MHRIAELRRSANGAASPMPLTCGRAPLFKNVHGQSSARGNVQFLAHFDSGHAGRYGRRGPGVTEAVQCPQYAPAGWHERLGGQAMADAVVDRIVYRSTAITIEGTEPMRKRMAGQA